MKTATDYTYEFASGARQTRHFVPACDWPEYRQYLATERTAGRVIGWTTIPKTDGRGVDVICTHKAGR